MHTSSSDTLLNLASEHTLSNTREAVMLNLTKLPNLITVVTKLRNVVEFYNFRYLHGLILVFYCVFCATGINFYTVSFFYFYPKMNKSCKHPNVIKISSFQNGLQHHCGSTAFSFKSIIVETSLEKWKCYRGVYKTVWDGAFCKNS